MSQDAVFRALSDETRREILRVVRFSGRSVSDLAARFPHMSRPAVSKHLRVLRQAGLVSEAREGRLRRYRMEPGALRSVAEWLADVEAASADRLPMPTAPAARSAAGAAAGVTSGRRSADADRPSATGRGERLRSGLRPLPDSPAADETDWRAW